MRKYLRILFYLMLFLAINTIYAQKDIDDLELTIELEKNPAEKIKLLNEASLELKYADIKKSLEYAKQALELASDIDDTKSIVSTSNLLSELYWLKTSYKDAMIWATKAYELSNENDFKKDLAVSHLRLGVIYASIDSYDKASENYYKSLSIFQSLKEKEHEGIVLGNIGSLFSSQKIYDKAADYFSDALSIATEVNDSIGVKVALTNLASTLSNLEKYDMAKKMMEKAISIGEEDEINPWFGTNVLNLAIVNQNLGDLDTALVLFNRALDIFNQLGDEFYIARTYFYIADHYSKINDNKKSISNAIIALEKGKKYRFQRVVIDVTGLLHNIYSDQNMKDKAFKYLLLQSSVKDSLYKEENITKLSNLELQYEFERTQQEKRIDQQRKDFIFIIGSILFLIVIIVVFARLKINSKNNLLVKQKLETQLETRNKEFAVNVLYLMKKNEMLSNISEDLLKIEKEAVNAETKKAIHKIGFILKKNKEKDVWEEFEMRFKQVHTNFYENLSKKFPELTSNDLRICAFLKLNMSTKEISDITGQRVATLEATRSRIRKKLGISKTKVDLVTFLSQF